MEYRINEGGQLRSLTGEETKLVETTSRKIKAMNYTPNALDIYQARADKVLEIARANVDHKDYVMYHLAIGSGDITQEGNSRGAFTKFDFEGEQSLASFVAKQFSENLKAGRR